ncbi:hypothetical protein MCAP1_003280 [Malassezia caprae]|uniref:DH domain-containing protein n=1 Tax=Malassezia caprae TaxID=1381934 RepID=A0AAF0J1H2_9BASI|nr:hypothetical protein MCAP1_003280 [Malassezia caprae]
MQARAAPSRGRATDAPWPAAYAPRPSERPSMQRRARPAPAPSGAATRATRPTLGVPLMSPVDLGSDIPYLRDDMSPLLTSPAATPLPGAEAHTPPLFHASNTPSMSPTTQAPRLREVRSTPRLRSESPQPLPDALERIRQRTAHHSQALHRARDEGRAATTHELRTPPVPEWHEGEGWRAPSFSPPPSAGLGLSISSTTLRELQSPMVSELSLPEAEDRGTPDSGTAPWLGRHAELARSRPSPAPSLRRRISSSLLGGRRSRATPEPPSAGPSPTVTEAESMGRGPVAKRSNSNIRRLFRSVDEDEARTRPVRLRISPVVRPPTPVEKSPRLALQDLPEMPNPYATPVSAAAPVFEAAGSRQRQHLLNELASTEQTYATDLGIVQNIYLAHARRCAGLRPLPQGAASSSFPSIHTSPDMLPRSLSSLSSEESSTRPLLPRGGAASAPPLSVTDMHVIFAGLGPCYALAMEMSELLAAAARAQRTVSSVFLEKMGAIEQAFSLYCSRHEAAVARLADVMAKSAAATSFLHECDEMARPYTSAWDLPSLLIKPVQRVLKYPLFLQSILEQTSREDAEYAALQQALAQIQGVADRINESKRRMDVVGQHGFEPLSAPRAAFRRPVAGGALRKAKLPPSEGPLTSDEGHYLALVARLDAAEQQLERLAQYCAAWTSSVRSMYHAELLVVLAWMAVYEGGGSDRAAHERLVQLRLLVEHRLLGQACEQLEHSMERAVHAKIRGALQLVERPKMVVLNRSAKEAEYRKYLAERARRGAPPSEGATAFLSMHMQLVDEIPTLLQGLDVVLQHCVLALSQVQSAFYRVVAEQFEQYCTLYLPSAMTPTSASSASSARFPDMPGSPAGTSSSLGPGTAPPHATWVQGEAYALPATPSKGLPPLGGADISTMATTHGLLDEPLATPNPPRSVYPDPNRPIEGVHTYSLEHATPRATLPVLDLSFDGYAQTQWNLGHGSELDPAPFTRPSPHNSVFYDARSSLADAHALRRPSTLL